VILFVQLVPSPTFGGALALGGLTVATNKHRKK
jgi:hypothetical protein